MALHKIKDFYPDYHNQWGDQDILGYGLYSGNEKIGSVDDLLVDDQGKFRYLVINTGAWIFGKKVLLPIGRAQIDYNNRRIYVTGLTRQQVEALPEYDGSVLDYDYEERVRDVYRPTATSGVSMGNTGLGTSGVEPSVDTSTGINRDYSVEQSSALDTSTGYTPEYDRNYTRDDYTYDRDPNLYNLDNNQTLRLYEERLIANKIRNKTGEVAVGKHVETETVNVTVPIEKERVVIDRVTPTGSEAVTPGADAFREGEVARVEVYEETPDIRKEAFVREEVNVRKEVDRDTVEAQETVRKERLDIDKDGNPTVR